MNISVEMEITADSMADAIGQLQTEINSLKVVFQNCMVLDMITAQVGGVCTLINTPCCTYIAQSGQITTNIHTIWQRAKILHEVTKDDTFGQLSYGRHLHLSSLI